jgi:hypothetical protein
MSMSPLRALATGLAAGAIGTGAMTAYQTVASMRKGRSLHDALVPEAPDSWDEAPAPAQVGYRFLHGVFERDASPQVAPVMTNVVHWAYGIGWGALYGLVASTRGSGALSGAPFGTAVWGSSYVMLPAMGIYDPPWKYSAKSLAKDWSYHLVYGVATGVAFRLLARRGR